MTKPASRVKKLPKVSKGVATNKPRLNAKPFCPDHHREMSYRPERGTWQCNTAGCNMFAWPKDGDDRSKPIIAEKPFSIIWDQDRNKMFLRSANNILFEWEIAGGSDVKHFITDLGGGEGYDVHIFVSEMVVL